MKMLRFSVVAAVVALAGCDVPTSSSGGSGGNAVAEYQSFVGDAAIAEFVADSCPTLRLRTSTDNLVEGFVTQMIQAGYTPADIAAAQRVTSSDAVAAQAANRMANGGVVFGNAQSFCNFGRSEMSRGSRVGRFLT